MKLWTIPHRAGSPLKLRYRPLGVPGAPDSKPLLQPLCCGRRVAAVRHLVPPQKKETSYQDTAGESCNTHQREYLKALLKEKKNKRNGGVLKWQF